MSAESFKTISDSSLCESCGKEFSCGAKTKNCWCFDVKLPPQKLAEIGEKYNKCLCPSCLHDEDREIAG